MIDLKRKACKEDLQKYDRPSKRLKLDKKFMAIVSSSEYDEDSTPVLVLMPEDVVKQYKCLFKILEESLCVNDYLALTNRQIRKLGQIEEINLICKIIDESNKQGQNVESDSEGGNAAETETGSKSRSDDTEFYDEEIDSPMLWIKALKWLITSAKVTVISPDEKASFDMHLIGFKYLVFTY
jgi:hypothetical protein